MNAALLSVFLLCGWLFNTAQQQLQTAQAAFDIKSTELAQFRVVSNRLTSDVALHSNGNRFAVLPAIPSANVIGNVVRDMTFLAKQHKVSIANLAIESSAKSSYVLAQQQITVQIKGDYLNLKRWTGEMLKRHPWLAVKNMSWRSQEQNSLPLDAIFTWVLYVQD